MCGKNHTHDSSGNHWQFPHTFGFYHTHESSGNPILVDIILELSSPLTVVVVDDLGAIAAKTDRVSLSLGVVIFFAMKAPKVAIILLCLSKYI